MKIVHYPDPVLLEEAEEIGEITDEIRVLAADMLQTMYEGRGVGLAAPQVGVSKRLIVMNPSGAPGKGEEICLANPVVEPDGPDKVECDEGCLSLPGVTGNVLRWRSVVLRGFGMDGKERVYKAVDIFARAAQHEVDHLDGILIISKLSPADRAAVKNKLRELKSKAR